MNKHQKSPLSRADRRQRVLGCVQV